MQNAPLEKRSGAPPTSGYEAVPPLVLVSSSTDLESADIESILNEADRPQLLPIPSLADGFHRPSHEIISIVTTDEAAALDLAPAGPVLRDRNGATFAVDTRELLIGLADRSTEAAHLFAADYELDLYRAEFPATSRLYRSKTEPDLFEALVGRLRGDPRVLFAEYNPLVRLGPHRADPDVGPLSTASLTYWNHGAVGRDAVAANHSFDGTLVVVIDTLVAPDHPLTHGWLLDDPLTTFNFVATTTSDPHGTTVASIVASTMEVGDGRRYGIAAGVNLLSIAGLSGLYGGVIAGAQDRLDAINLVAHIAGQGFVDLPSGARVPADRVVVNCSWKIDREDEAELMSSGGDVELLSFREAFSQLEAAGALVVCSAGNSNAVVDPHFPSDYGGCISVAGIDSSKRRYEGSFGSNYGPNVDLAAPGAGLLVADRDNGFRLGNGTSFAAPHVTAACALFWSANPHLSAAEVREAVVTRTINIDALNPQYVGALGSGLVYLPNLF
jgi:subtilisin family serine protease